MKCTNYSYFAPYSSEVLDQFWVVILRGLVAVIPYTWLATFQHLRMKILRMRYIMIIIITIIIKLTDNMWICFLNPFHSQTSSIIGQLCPALLILSILLMMMGTGACKLSWLLWTNTIDSQCNFMSIWGGDSCNYYCKLPTAILFLFTCHELSLSLH